MERMRVVQVKRSVPYAFVSASVLSAAPISYPYDPKGPRPFVRSSFG